MSRIAHSTRKTGPARKARANPIHRSGVRAKAASAALGPVGHLFNSPSTAHVLSAIIREPARLFALRDLLGSIGGSKGTVQVALRVLEKAQLIRRQGRGPQTTYQYAAEGAVGRAMLKVIEASRRSAELVESDIPWLADYAAQPGGRITTFHTGRTEREVGEGAVEKMLRAGEPAESREMRRARPGLVTRG